MSKPFLAAAAISIALAGCSPTTIPTSLPPEVQAVITDARAICGFLPTISSVVAIVGSAVPGVDTAETIAEAICNAVGTLPKSFAAGGQKHVSVAFHGRRYIVSGHFAH